jgi:flagellar assembly protein FliH
MSPDATVATFRPAALLATSAGEVDTRARAAGYAAGWAAGARAAAEAAAEQEARRAQQHAQAQAQRDAAVADAVDALERTVLAAAARTAPVVDQVRRGVYEAALELAAAVLQRELTPGPDSARALLERVLAIPADLGVHTVRLNPADLAQVRALVSAPALPAGVELVADPSLAPGDTVSVHPTGYLDGQVRAALDRARRVLLEDQA